MSELPELRKDVVVRLVEARDEDELQRLVALHEPTPDELRLAGRACAQLAVEELEDAGVLRHAGTVLDLGQRQLQALSAAYGAATNWWLPPSCNDGAGDARTLGDLLKIVPVEEARKIRDYLAWARLLAADDAHGRM
ncbi:hypothetical protein [Lentzea flaviverrucosa]|uniref:Uncharacterized protein n=1 Tax=Lentzea flaviverrucosa TaxID=200379 RepID=A0A1H9XA96_9PSEU|nr:hypothetical protein [Lentzea flaviverrucosa]RDI21700.1 hypothetical protein DFR72_113247 [Lentzea flaviverrucosa]SES43052.1 hypothetical protein SAMN05216195_11433 [Lentzea flaviverrucosa]